MMTRNLYLLVLLCLIAFTGCSTPPPPTDPPPPIPNQPPPKPPVPPRSQVPLRPQVQPELTACKEFVKDHNASLILAVTVAITKATGTPVEANETTDHGQKVYRVNFQNPSGPRKLIVVTQREVENERIREPSSASECKNFDQAKDKRIVTAMLKALKQVPGNLEKAIFEEYKGHSVYAVTIQDSAGKYHVVRVDPDDWKIRQHEVIGN